MIDSVRTSQQAGPAYNDRLGAASLITAGTGIVGGIGLVIVGNERNVRVEGRIAAQAHAVRQAAPGSAARDAARAALKLLDADAGTGMMRSGWWLLGLGTVGGLIGLAVAGGGAGTASSPRGDQL